MLAPVSLGPQGPQRRSTPRDLHEQLAPDGGLELGDIHHRHHEGSDTADHAGGIVEIEVGEVEEARSAGPEHNGQAVYDDAGGDQRVACLQHRASGVVGPVAGHIDHLP